LGKFLSIAGLLQATFSLRSSAALPRALCGPARVLSGGGLLLSGLLQTPTDLGGFPCLRKDALLTGCDLLLC
jgi:hypothetical protein